MQITLCIEPHPTTPLRKNWRGVCIQPKTGRCRGYFGSWGHVLVAVAVVER